MTGVGLLFSVSFRGFQIGILSCCRRRTCVLHASLLAILAPGWSIPGLLCVWILGGKKGGTKLLGQELDVSSFRALLVWCLWRNGQGPAVISVGQIQSFVLGFSISFIVGCAGFEFGVALDTIGSSLLSVWS